MNLAMESFWKYATSPTVMAIASVLFVAIVAWLAISWLLKWREQNNGDYDLAESCLKDFEEMRLGGDLTEAEYRNIRALFESKSNTTRQSVDSSESQAAG